MMVGSLLLVGLLPGVPLPIAGAALAVEDECENCHSSAALRVQNKKLYDYYQNYLNSMHGLAGLSCADCHGGDSTTQDFEIAHAGVMDRVRFDHIPETCGECHDEQMENFVQSDHYQILMDKGTAPNCVTCHGSMDMDFFFTSLVRTTCQFCHNQQSGTAPDVPDRAEYILNKINIIKGYRGLVRKYADDPQLVREIDDSYRRLTGHWHLFDFEQVETETEYLFDLLRREKAKAIKKKRDK